MGYTLPILNNQAPTELKERFEALLDNKEDYDLIADIDAELRAIVVDAPTFGDESGTPGDCEINAVSGRAAIENGDDECIVTNEFVTTNSVVIVRLESIDADLDYVKC